jgi:hypothetical protein
MIIDRYAAVLEEQICVLSPDATLGRQEMFPVGNSAVRKKVAFGKNS